MSVLTALRVLAVAILAMVAILATVPRPVTVPARMSCPSEDGGIPGCVWDGDRDGNRQRDLDGPRWLIYPDRT